jgi:hypothetical protein
MGRAGEYRFAEATFVVPRRDVAALVDLCGECPRQVAAGLDRRQRSGRLLEKLQGGATMGSSGTGRLTDYSGKHRSNDGSGGGSGEDPCRKAFSSNLEEVERCPYYKQHGEPPKQGTEVVLIFKQRPAVTTRAGELIGYLPTSLNYLRACLQQGYSYEGAVVASRVKPTVRVTVDVAPLT